jgi:hypothetical protein
MKLRQKLNLISLLAAIVSMVACSEQKLIQKAQQRVLTNESAFNYIGNKWAKLNPCGNDTTFIVKSDTTILADTTFTLVQDTVSVNKIIVKKVPSIINKVVHIKDTLTKIIIDNRALSIALDSASFYKNQYYISSAKLAEAKKGKLIWMFSFFASFAAITICIALRFKK